MRGPAALAVLLCAPVVAQEGAIGSVTTIEGREVKGTVSIAEDGKVTVAGAGEAVVIDLEEVATFTAGSAAAKAQRTPHHLWLRSGQEFGALALRGVPGADGRPARIAADLALGVTIELPITTLRALRHGGPDRQQPGSFGADLQDPADNTDMIWVQKDGKQHRFQVTVNGMRPDAIVFDLRGKQHDFELDGLVAIVFGNNTGFAMDPQPAPRVALDFDSGDHLEGKLLGLDTAVRLRLDEGCEVSAPAARIARLTVASDRLRWLSDLTPAVTQTPAFDRVWPWTKDRSLAGPGFVLGGETWSRGVGMVPRTRLTYDLGGSYDTFQAMIGIDDRGGPQAHAVFRVLVDGNLVYESTPRTRGLPAEPVAIELNKCQQLAIEVDFGKNYDLGDYCAFANARVLRR
ncbi:MAG: NPCBM/NEW2 domain-containing protein, partial [Planctomycetes bacterium]|nr:NPCBM/NEW2 domain-containing protein [Planctomycetota bacterium]